MAIRRSEIDYLQAAYLGDHLVVGNWVTSMERVRAARHYEIHRVADGRRLLKAKIEFVCINLDTGAPCRMPPEFIQAYRVEHEVRLALVEHLSTAR